MSTKGDFKFLNTSKPGENLSAANRKLIRSNATLQRAKKRRRASAASPKCNEVSMCVRTPSPAITRQVSPLPIKMKQSVYAMLEYQEKVVGPALFPWKMLHDLHPSHRILMCMALQSEKVLHGVVAIAALWYLNVERLSGSDTSSWQIMALGHKHKAIELVREHFSDDGGCGPLDVATALSMMNLASLELIFLNEAGWSSHMKALRRIADLPEARTSLSMARFTILDVDLLGCYIFGCQPFFTSEGIESDAMALRASRRLIEQPTNSQDVAIQQSQDGFWAVYKPLRSILAQMNTINKFIANASLDTYLQMHVQAYILTRFSIEYSVFEVLDKPDLDDESKAVCLAAQIYINKVYRTFEKHHMVPDRIAQRLKEPLLAVIQSHYENKEHCDLILWAAVLGGLGSRDKDLRRVFVFAISAVCISMGWTAWSEVLGQLNLWVWCKNCLEEECSELWSEVEEYIEDIRAPGLKVDFHGS